MQLSQPVKPVDQIRSTMKQFLKGALLNPLILGDWQQPTGLKGLHGLEGGADFAAGKSVGNVISLRVSTISRHAVPARNAFAVHARRLLTYLLQHLKWVLNSASSSNTLAIATPSWLANKNIRPCTVKWHMTRTIREGSWISLSLNGNTEMLGQEDEVTISDNQLTSLPAHRQQ